MPRIEPPDRARLLQLARRALEARVRRGPLPDFWGADLANGDARGVFVTIRCAGELRGCLGRLPMNGPLAEAVVDLAAAVADSDPRFSPVLSHELASVALEISILGAERPLGEPREIETGRHGLIVEQGSRRGLLLPQVAAEHGWESETFLAHACRKAALPPDAWRRGAEVFIFEAVVFGEEPR